MPPAPLGWYYFESPLLRVNVTRYMRVRYEDLMENTEVVVRNLYSFMNTEVTKEVTQFIADHSSKNRYG